MKAAFLKEQREIWELLGVVGCRDHRKDADEHRGRMLREVGTRSYALADSIDPMNKKALASELLRTLQVAHDALTDCAKFLLQRGPQPCPSFMATATGAVSRALFEAQAREQTPAEKQLDLALSACRSIRFATKQAERFGGEFSLNDLLTADRLARAALGELADVRPAKVATISRRSLAAHKANWTRTKKGGRT